MAAALSARWKRNYPATTSRRRARPTAVEIENITSVIESVASGPPEVPLTDNPEVPKGRRVLTVDSINLLMKLSAQHGSTCADVDLAVISEFRKGMCSLFKVKCSGCGGRFVVNSDTGTNNLMVNEAAVWAGTSTGVGFKVLRRAFAIMEIPFVGQTTYYNLVISRGMNMVKESSAGKANKSKPSTPNVGTLDRIIEPDVLSGQCEITREKDDEVQGHPEI